MHALNGRKVGSERGKSVGENGAVRGSLQLREGRSRELADLNQVLQLLQRDPSPVIIVSV